MGLGTGMSCSVNVTTGAGWYGFGGVLSRPNEYRLYRLPGVPEPDAAGFTAAGSTPPNNPRGTTTSTSTAASTTGAADGDPDDSDCRTAAARRRRSNAGVAEDAGDKEVEVEREGEGG